MSSEQAGRLVLIAGAAEAAIVLAAMRGEDDKERRLRALWAVGVLTLGLAIAADFVPQLAAPFAILVAVAMATRYPGELGKALGIGPDGFGRLGAAVAGTVAGVGGTVAEAGRTAGTAPGYNERRRTGR